MQYRATILFIAGLLLCACQSYEQQAALLKESSIQDRQILQRSISEMLNGAEVSLSASAFVSANEVIVERRRQINGSLGRDYGRPDHFRLWLVDEKCLLEHIESGNTQIMSSLTCRLE